MQAATWVWGIVTGIAMCAVQPARADEAEGVSARLVGPDRLFIEFSHAMRTWDNELRTDLVRVVPSSGGSSLPTQCRWDGDTQLTCTFTGARPVLATRYAVTVKRAPVQADGNTLRVPTLSVETPRPAVWGQTTAWIAGRPTIRLTVSKDVDSRSLHGVLRLRVDGVAIPVPTLEAVTTGYQPERSFDLHLPALGGADRRVELAVVPGLASTAGPLRGIDERVLVRARVQESPHVLGASCNAPELLGQWTPTDRTGLRCRAGSTIELRLTHRPDPSSFAALQARLPAGVSIYLPVSDTSHAYHDALARFGPVFERAPGPVMTVNVEGVRRDVLLDLNGLRTGDGTRITAALLPIHMGDLDPLWRGTHRSTLLDQATLEAAMPLAEVVNLPALPLTVDVVGRNASRVETRSPAARDNQPRALLPAATLQALREGGWSRWTATSLGGVEFAAPAFDLAAFATRREVSAWANAWNGGGVAGAEVELLMWRSPQSARVVARGRTNADGIALLRLPDAVLLDEEASDVRWLLRAARGAQRAVLPLGEGSGVDIGKPLRRRAWGVSDRPLYRAGDTVRYRLWQREDQGRYRAITNAEPIEVRLFDQQRENTIQRWQAVPARDGSLHGELVLPEHLTDSGYCIGIKVDATYDDSVEGACFFVGTHRGQDLWATATTPDRVLREGDRFDADIAGGFYSGGPAVGLALQEVQATLDPTRIEEAYPQHGAYTFVDVFHDDVDFVSIIGIEDVELSTDQEGRARVSVPMTPAPPEGGKRVPAFATVDFSATLEAEGREGTTATAWTTRYAHFDRYVGLRLDPEWPDAVTPVSAAAIVIDAHGKSVDSPRVEVTVEFAPFNGWGASSVSSAWSEIGRCSLQVGLSSLCDGVRASTGRYRWTARSGDAAPAVIERVIWRSGVTPPAAEEAELTFDGLMPRTVDAPGRFHLRQPYPQADVMVQVLAGERIIEQRVLRVSQPVVPITIERGAGWPRNVQVETYVRERGASHVANGLRTPARATNAYSRISWPEPDMSRALEINFQPVAARPGRAVELVIRNTSPTSRDVTVSVMDDALRALGAKWVAMADPHGTMWLESSGMGGSIRTRDFGEWNGGQWSHVFDHLIVPAPASAEPPPEPPIVFDDPAPMSAPAPRSDSADSFAFEEGESLDRIAVTGSRIKRSDLVYVEDTAPDPSLKPGERPAAASGERDTSAGVRLRTRFADTAHWLPQLTLAPGESRTLRFELPDNLTRWRAVAWSSDVDDGFAMHEATLEAGLPVEVRVQAPVRVFAGDALTVNSNVRHVADAHASATLQLHAQGAALDTRLTPTLGLAPLAQAATYMPLAPSAVGALRVTAMARTDAGEDGVVATIEVAEPTITTRKVQAAWLDADALSLALPDMPASARGARIEVLMQPGATAWVERWSADLRDYVHRCWEQMLSRALAAALAIERNDPAWPDARGAVDEALRNAGVFQQSDGGFVYFADQASGYSVTPTPLAAYSVQALRVLRELGHPVDPVIETRVRDELAKRAMLSVSHAKTDVTDDTVALAAFAAAETDGVALADLDLLWSRSSRQVLPVQVAIAQALARNRHPQASAAVTALLSQAPLRGGARSFRSGLRFDAWMRSNMRDQCALIDVLRMHPSLAADADRRALIAGLGDLYGGGIEGVDTQTGALCLLALRNLVASSSQATSARVELGVASTELVLPARTKRATWSTPVVDASPLGIAPTRISTMPVGVIATLAFEEDARTAQASAIGFALTRRHAVLRDGAWVPLDGQRVRLGDWVRVTLVLDNTSTRHFVAITDSIAGGLQPTDLSLDGIAGIDLKRVSDIGSREFETRRLDPRAPKFYAEQLSAGTHEVHYFARVANAGDYLAAPAVAELMYGTATRARSDGVRVRIDE